MTWAQAAEDISRQLEAISQLDSASIILVGSAARGVNTPESDIDILVLSPRSLPLLGTPANVQMFTMTRDQFMQKLRSADDFAQWALRYGKTISDRSGWWQNLIHTPNVEIWPSWQRKVEQSESRLSFALRLLDSKDYDHAQEEYLLAARHLARGLLLKLGVFPLSQPELPQQLREAGLAEIAEMLDVLVKSPNDADLRRAHELLTGWIRELSLQVGHPGTRRAQ